MTVNHDDRTARGYPLPHPDNLMHDEAAPADGDVMRLRAALTALDADIADLDEGKADSGLGNVPAATLAQKAADSGVGSLWCGLAAGTANALTVTPAVTVPGLYDGLTVRFVVQTANTAATTLVVGALPVKPLRDPVGALLAADALSPALVTTATYIAAADHWRQSGGAGGVDLSALHASMFLI